MTPCPIPFPPNPWGFRKEILTLPEVMKTKTTNKEMKASCKVSNEKKGQTGCLGYISEMKNYPVFWGL